MNNNLTHLVFLVDRSGSMYSISDAMNEAINSIVEQQKEEPGECTLSIYQFDSWDGWTDYSTPPLHRKNNLQIEVVCENVKIKDAPKFTIKPRGSTPLIDATCLTIDKVGQIFATLPELERPAKVIFAIVTDGHENHSTDFKQQDLMLRVNTQRDVYKWTIMFLGANQDAVLEGEKYGISTNFSMTYAANKMGTKGMSDSLSNKFSKIRSMSNKEYCTNAMTGNEVGFNEEDREVQTIAKEVKV